MTKADANKLFNIPRSFEEKKKSLKKLYYLRDKYSDYNLQVLRNKLFNQILESL